MKKALGRGLSALIPDSYVKEVSPEESVVPKPHHGSVKGEGLQLLPISSVNPNPDQPRKEFDEEGIKELAASIKEKGILQPIVVKKGGSGNYELVCGERRLRAATACGLTEIPAVVKDVASEDLLEWALIENLQRRDLNPLEEAEAFERLAVERMLSHDEIAKRIGKNRTTITNTLRLLRLPPEVKGYIAQGRISAGHARAILGLLTPAHQRQMAKRIVEDNLSVRQVEAIVNRSVAHKRKAKKARQLTTEIVDLENRFAQHLGTQVRFHPKKDQKQGRIEIFYFSLDDLDRLMDKVRLPKG